MESITRQEVYTKAFLTEAKITYDSEDLTDFMNYFWWSKYRRYSLQLSNEGFYFVTHEVLNLQSKVLKIDIGFVSIGDSLVLQKNLSGPFYIYRDKMHLFADSDIMQIMLCGGTYVEFINYLKYIDQY